MKLYSIIVIALLKLTTSHHILGLAGKQQTEVASPDSYINLGQLQKQEHNEVLDTYRYGHYIPGFRFLKRRHYITTLPYYPYYTFDNRVASPSTGIAVGTVKNEGQGAVFKE